MRRFGERVVLVVVAVLSVLVVVPSSPALAQTGPATTTSKSAPGSVLAGEPIPYGISVTNSGNARLFNISVRDVLPLGVTYQGPTSPAGAGEPQVITNQVPDPLSVPPNSETIPQQTLIWSNVADLAIGETKTLNFNVNLNEVADPLRPSLPVYVVGSSVSNVAETYTATTERAVQRFDVHGVPVPTNNIVESSSDPAVTVLSPIEIRKSEPSPEGELLRGVHDQTTVYTLDVEVAEGDEVNGVTDVVVTDYLSAELEFLGCGGVDNSSGPEYPGAPSLEETPLISPCEVPSEVETVVLVVDEVPGVPAGVYTKVTWVLGDLDPSEIVTIRYAAGVPLRANAPFGGTAPDPGSLAQTANLDNNTGPSTRETATEQSARNYAQVAGTYSGPVEGVDPGTPVDVVDDDAVTRSIEDVRIRKEIVAPDPANFYAGEDAHYNVIVETSEYVTASGIVITDTIPNGLCPYSQDGYDEPAPDCGAPAPADRLPTPAIASVTPNVDEDGDPIGGYIVTFEPIALAPNTEGRIDYWALMREDYEGGPNDGKPTVSGDSFTNTVAATAVTSPIPGTGETGDVTVADESEATLESSGVSLDKRIRRRGVATDFDLPGDPCPPPGATDPDPAGADTEYVNPADLDAGERAAELGFRLGDEVCFLIRVDFSDDIRTRNPVLVDFLPTGMEYVVGSLVPVAGSIPPGTPDVEPGYFVLTPGEDDDGTRYVPPGAVLEVVFKAKVVDIPDAGVPQVTGNLAKLTVENTAGQTASFRDRTGLAIVPAAPVSITKGVAAVDDPPFPAPGPPPAAPDQDHVLVREGSRVTFRVDVSNDGTALNLTEYSLRGFQIWDVLPAGISCAQIENPTGFDGIITPAPGQSFTATCTNPLQPGHPSFDGNATRSAIVWTFPVSDADRSYWAVAAGGTRTLFYDMLIPEETSIGTVFENTASVRSYQAFTNVFDVASDYFPADNVDTTVTPEQENTPAASDPSDVYLPDAIATKTGVTGIDEPDNGNDGPIQAVPGETITYTIGVEIPAHTTVFDATLRDILPGQVELFGPAPTARFYPDASDLDEPQPLPVGFVLDSDVVLEFPDTYPTGATAQRFEIVIPVRVLPGIMNTPSFTDTARFVSSTSLGGTPRDPIDATYQNSVVQASPSITKSNSSGGVVTAGQTVTYTLTGENVAGAPTLHDTVLSDCIPDGLGYVLGSASRPIVGGPVPGDPATNGCSADTTFLAMSVGSIPGGGSQVATYQVTVETTAVGGESYTNTASLIGSSLPNGTNDPTNEQVYQPEPARNTVRVPGFGIDKQVVPTDATVGELVTYGVTVTIPADVNFYQAAARDRLPAGIDPATVALVPGSVACTPACTVSGTLLPPVPSGGGSMFAVLFGDLAASPDVRTITYSYTARIANVGSVTAGATVTNTVQSVWDNEQLAEPTSPTYPWDEEGAEWSATVRVTEPSVTATKAVSDATPEPGDPPFTYTITLRNATQTTPPNISEAYNLTVVDTLPAGVIVDGASITPPPSSFVPATATAPGSITWGPAVLTGPIAPGGTLALAYTATLADSTFLDASARVNTADLDRYEGLPASEPAGVNRRIYEGNAPTAQVTPQFPVLSVAKTAVDGEPTLIGAEYTWRVVVTNDGGGTAHDVDVTDVLPPNWSYVAASARVTLPIGIPTAVEPTTGGACPASTLCWFDVGDLAPGQSVTVEFDATPGPDVVTSPGVGSATRHTNTARAAASDGGGFTGNANGPYVGGPVTASTRIDRANLSIDKSHVAGTAIAGTNFSWSVVVRNAATSDPAVGVFTVTETLPTLPAGVTYVSASGTGWTCVPPSPPAPLGTVTCTRTGTLAPNAAFPAITVTVAIPADTPDGATISNTAAVALDGTYEAPTDLADNTDTDVATVVTRADLRVVKTLLPPGLEAGTNATYQLTVDNLGPSVSRAALVTPITLVDTLPAGATFVSAVDTAGTPSWSCAHTGPTPGGQVTCTRTTDMAVGDTSTIAVVVSLPASATGDYTNRAVVTPQVTDDPVPGNNTSEITNPVVQRTDLGIDKTALGPNVPGLPTVYRIRVTNFGPADAAAVHIQDTLPAGLSYASFSDVRGQWTCAIATSPQPVPGFSCDLQAPTLPLAYTGDPTVDYVEVQIEVNTAPSVVGTVTNSATVSGVIDDNPANDTDTADLTFVGVADLALTKSSSGTAVPGGTVTWTINVANLGPSDSQPAITVTDQLPTGIIGPVTAIGEAGHGWSCSTTVALLVTCTKSSVLAAGADTDITITAVVDPAVATPAITSVTNSATVVPTTTESNDPDDPKTANNTDTDTVTILEPEVVLTKTVGDDTPQPGDEFDYTIELRNVGLAPAYNMTVTDVLPAGIEWVSGGTYTEETRTVTFVVPGPLAVGGTTSVSFVATLADSDTIDDSEIVNTASLDEYESVPSGGREYVGNVDDAEITPRFPELTALKEAVGDNPTYIATAFAWRITIINEGDGDAAGIDVTDLLPPNWTYQAGSTTITTPSGVTTGAVADPVVTDTDPGSGIRQELVWTDIGDLPAGTSLTVDFRAIPTLAVAEPPPGSPGVGSGVPHTNRASGAGDDLAGFPGNLVGDYETDDATADAFIHAADVVIDKADATTPAIAGAPHSWTIDVRNDGDDPAVGPFLVTDTLPDITPTPLTFVSAAGDGWDCTNAALVVTCNRANPDDTLPAPTSPGDPDAAFPTITITVNVPSDYLPDPGMTNTASVTARTYDPDTTNNTDTVVTPVVGRADLAILKVAPTATVVAGGTATYSLNVTNNGPSTSRASITVSDPLAPGLTFVDGPTFADGDAWDCVAAAPTGPVTCTLAGDLLAGAPAPQIALTVGIASGAAPGVDIENTATVTAGATDDLIPGNNTSTATITPTTSADLAILKQATGELVAGQEATYRLTVANNGPSDAVDPQIVDLLPAGLTYVGFSNPTVAGESPGVWACSAPPDDQSFTCQLDRPLVAGGFVVVDVQVQVAPDIVGSIVNRADVSSTTPDPIDDNNFWIDDSEFDALADLAIMKTGPTTEVVAGTNFQWTLAVTNGGPSDSVAPITVVDTIPEGIEYLGVQGPTPWSCTAAPPALPDVGVSAVVTCIYGTTLTTIAPGNAAPLLVLNVRALPDAGEAEVTNRAVVIPTTEDPVLPNNATEHTVELIDRADLAITKTPDDQIVRAGENATFSLAVTNNGPSTADNVIVRDELPSGLLAVLPITAAGWDCTASTVSIVDCRRATLDPGPAAAITVVATVGSGVPDGTPLENTATVASATIDTNLANNADDAVVDVVADADLAITKTHPAVPDPVIAGTQVEFEIVVTNNGPSDALADIVVTDTLPVGFTFLSASGPWECEANTATPQVIECTSLAGGLVAGATAGALSVLTQVDPTLDAGVYINTAAVESPTHDSDLDDNVDTDAVNVGTIADVSIVKSHDPADVRIGEEMTFTLDVHNDGPSEARDVVVTDTVPDSLPVVEVVADPDVWDCSASSGQDVLCDLLDPLQPGDDVSIAVVVLVEPEAFPGVDNTATVETSTTDPDPDDNTSTDEVDVPRLVDLYVTKTHEADAVHVGEAIEFTLTVGNNGPIDDDAAVTVVDTMPVGLVPTAATSDDADCDIDGATVTCVKADGLAVDETFTITITADVTPAAYPLAVNAVEVSSPTDDVDETNNATTDPVVVPPLVDLAIAKTHADGVQVGGRITYTLTVTNNGPTAAPPPVRVLDTLPGSLTPVSADSTSMTCDITGQTVTCQSATSLAVGATFVITVVADVGPAATPSVENTAIVTMPGCTVTPTAGPVLALHVCPDVDLTNNVDTDVAEVAPLVQLGVDKSLAGQLNGVATWTILVTNRGPNDTVLPIRLVDQLPSSLTYVSAAGDGWVCGAVLQIVTCTYAGVVASGATAPPVTIVTNVTAARGTEIVNVVGVDGGGPGTSAVTDSATTISDGRLPSTGGGAIVVLRWAIPLVLAGIALIVVTRRRTLRPE